MTAGEWGKYVQELEEMQDQKKAFAQNVWVDKNGEVWRSTKSHKEVSGMHSISKVQAYVEALPPDGVAADHDVSEDLPYIYQFRTTW